MSEEEKPLKEDATYRYEIKTLDLEGGTSTDETGIYDPKDGTYKSDSEKLFEECGTCRFLQEKLDRLYYIYKYEIGKLDLKYYREKTMFERLWKEHRIYKHDLAIL